MRDWRDNAACIDSDPELFFPVSYETRHGDEQVRVAKSVCAGCSVLALCQEWAVATQAHGIAGGLTPEERTKARLHRGWAAEPPTLGTFLKRTVGVSAS